MDVTESTNKLLMAPAARRAAPINFRHSVRDGVEVSAFTDVPAESRQAARAHARAGRVRMWGSMPNKDSVWNRVREGDVLLFYTEGHFAAAARVDGKRRDATLADAVWKPDPDSWRNILFLRDVTAIDMPVQTIGRLLGYAPNWSGPREFFFPDLVRQIPALAPYADLNDFLASLTADSSLSGRIAASESYADQLGRVFTDQDVEQLLERMRARNVGAIPASTNSTVKRGKRDANLVRELKQLYDGKCQVCGDTFLTSAGMNYCEAAHIVPIERRLPGIDSYLNIAVLCATCHKKLDYGGMRIAWDPLAHRATYTWQGANEPLLINKHIHTGWAPSP